LNVVLKMSYFGALWFAFLKITNIPEQTRYSLIFNVMQCDNAAIIKYKIKHIRIHKLKQYPVRRPNLCVKRSRSFLYQSQSVTKLR